MLGKISVTFDLSGISLLGADNSACHWAMSCGNDTIEGQLENPYEVPAPAAFGLAVFAVWVMWLHAMSMRLCSKLLHWLYPGEQRETR